MSKMSKFFSLKLYLQGLKKSRLQGITIAGIVTTLTALVPTVNLLSTPSYTDGYIPPTRIMGYDGFAIPLLLLLLFTPILTLSMFSFLNKRNESDFYHSIPFTRPCVYFSFLAAIMTWVIIALVAALLSATVLWSLVPYKAVPLSLPFIHFIVYFLATLLLTAFTVVAMTLTGTSISNLLIFALLFLFFRVAGVLFVACMETLYPVVILDLSVAKFLQLDFNIPIALVNPYLFSGDFSVFDNYGLWIYTAVISIGLIAAGCWLYTRRRSEMAGQSAPNPILQHIYRIMISLPFVFLTVYVILIEGLGELTLVLTVITLLVYYVYEIVTTKQLKNLAKASAFIPVLIVGGIVFALTVTVSGKTALAYTPDADEIKSVSIYDPNMDRNPSYELMNTAGVAIDDPKVLEFVVTELKEMQETVSQYGMNRYRYPENYYYDSYEDYGKDVYYSDGMSVDYEKTDYVRWSVKIVGKWGRVCGRTITITMDEFLYVTQLFSESKEYEDALLKLPTQSEIVHTDYHNIYYDGDAERDVIWANFVTEYNALSLEEKIEYKTQVMQGNWYQYAISVSGMKGSQSFYSTYPISPDLFPETARLYTRIGNLNEKEDFQNALTLLNDSTPTHTQLNIESNEGYHSLTEQTKPIREAMEFIESCELSDTKDAQIVRLTLWVENESTNAYLGGTKYYILSQDDLVQLFSIMQIDGYVDKGEIADPIP